MDCPIGVLCGTPARGASRAAGAATPAPRMPQSGLTKTLAQVSVSNYVIPMLIPTRILSEKLHGFTKSRRPVGVLDGERHQDFLDAAVVAFASYGRPAITFKSLATALFVSQALLRRHFVDLDCLLAEIIDRHLRTLIKLVSDIPPNDPDCFALRRAAYFRHTRGDLGGLAHAHAIMVRDRHTLPLDMLDAIEATRLVLGDILAGPDGDEALALLYSPRADLVRIETALSALRRPVEPAIAERIERRLTRPVSPPPLPAPEPGVLDCSYSPGLRCMEIFGKPRPRGQAPPPG